ncbi:cytochrome c oxidase subunit 2 [Desulfobaculum xiamenense]|uniref:Cytochrome c oxidase subunit 2 n=1 Tax=Desulfobaculum xiamenense TaxID=995050 RepID=A0A846QMY7_9BACT|nr:cytochrome c oxidase subunit II [Desulfobaculum xiamenense]NJB67832.1 cytochrome c oxidase subunit 2 [Desulfobaculum xiamenense]
MNSVVNAVAKVDQAFLFILAVSVGILLLVTGLMLWFVYRYHHSRHPRAEEVRESVWMEVAWTIIPTILAMGMFWFGWDSFRALQSAPQSALQVRVEGRMWSWAFIYPNGRRSGMLYVPQGTPVRLSMTSLDVLHSFYVPAFRIKRDTVPGMATYAWFMPEREGDYDILCAEYCGLKHANMLGTVRVVAREAFDEWYAGTGARGTARGEELLAQYGCTACHSLDGTDGVGPTLRDVFGMTRVLVMPDGSEREVRVDGDYLRRAILDPGAELLKGYQPVMPPYEGVIPDEDLRDLIGWISSRSEGVDAGREVAEAQGCLGCHSTDGSEVAGPSFKGLFGRRGMVERAGRREEVTVDEAYLREAIVEPQAAVPEGYQPIMPAYTELSAEDMDSLLRWLTSLGKRDGG